MIFPRGFTLLEMVVVMTILAIVATLAVRSIDGRLDQSRYENTQRQLREIEEAILGPSGARQPDGTLSVSGFLNDVGRVPKAVATSATLSDGSTGTVQMLTELWDNPGGLQPYALRRALNSVSSEVPVADEDGDIYVGCGWRGPYLRLGAGEKFLQDSWGNFFDLLRLDRTDVAAGDQVEIIRSLGVDNVVNTSAIGGYEEDVYLALRSNAFDGSSPATYPAAPAVQRTYASAISGTVTPDSGSFDLSGTNKIVVRYYGPDPSTGKIKVIKQEFAGMGASVNSVTYSLSDNSITPGIRVLRAYYTNSTGTTVLKKSNVVRVVLNAGGNQQDFVLK